MNNRAVLELLLAEGPMARTEIGERTGLSKVTVSQLLARLDARGMVELTGTSGVGRRGPNAALYGVLPSVGYGAGVDVGPDAITVAVADITGTVRGRGTLPGGSTHLVDGLHKALAAAVDEAGVPDGGLHSVVIGTPGVVDPATGRVGPVVDVPGWVPGLPRSLGERLGCPVTVENDVNLAALAERTHGRATDTDDFVLLWVGRGVGMALVLGGRLHRGVGGAAGEIGYLPVPGAPVPDVAGHPNAAALQSLVGADAVRTLAAAFGHDDSTAAAGVADAVTREDTPFLDELGHRLAVAVAAVCAVLDPGLVVLSGPVGRAGGAALAQRIAEEVPRIVPVRIAVRTTDIEADAVLTGAVHVATRVARDVVFDEEI